MKLFGSLTSPYVRKVRIVLAEKKIPCEFIVDSPWEADSKIPHLNPLGKVPVLVLDNGEPLFDSSLIVEYLDSLGGEPLIPAGGDARWDVLRWANLAQGMLDATVVRLLETRRPAAKQDAGVIRRQETKIASALAFADKSARGSAYLVGERFSLADIAFAVALEYLDFRYAHDWRAQYLRLSQWLARMSSRDTFIATVPPGMEKPHQATP